MVRFWNWFAPLGFYLIQGIYLLLTYILERRALKWMRLSEAYAKSIVLANLNPDPFNVLRWERRSKQWPPYEETPTPRDPSVKRPPKG